MMSDFTGEIERIDAQLPQTGEIAARPVHWPAAVARFTTSVAGELDRDRVVSVVLDQTVDFLGARVVHI